MAINKPVNWNKINKTDNSATNLVLSILYKYRVVQPRPLKYIYLSGVKYDSLIRYWQREKNIEVFIPVFDGVEVKRGTFVKWEHEEEFYPEVVNEINDLTFAPRKKETEKVQVNKELDDLYASGAIKTKFKADGEV